MQRRFLAASTIALAAAGATAARAAEPQHRLVLHVGGGAPGVMTVALHNIANAFDEYAKLGQTIAIELVAIGPGYTMLRADKSPVVALLAATQTKYPSVVFSACQNSRAGFARAEGKAPQDIPELPGVNDVPAGIVRLVELQEQGYRYVRA